jgi:SAM-dependent methyltransferase
MTGMTDPRGYQDRHGYVFRFGEDLLALLAPQAGERILDLGCGTGQLTAAMAESGATVVGLDISREMLAQARVNYPAIEFIHGDASNFTLPEPVDAILSNAALHWVSNADGAAASVARALKPGGRFVAELGGHGNVQSVVDGLDAVLGPGFKHPWYFPAIGEYATILERHGLEVREARLFDRPTQVEGEDGFENWLAVFARGALAGSTTGADPQREAEIFQAVSARLRESRYRDGVWTLDYRRLRLFAVK